MVTTTLKLEGYVRGMFALVKQIFGRSSTGIFRGAIYGPDAAILPPTAGGFFC